MGRERRKWTQEEDKFLVEAIKKRTQESQPLLWRELAKSVPGRSNKDCRRRWCNILAGGTSKGSWTESEDERLCRAVQDNGPKWTRVAAAVGTRNSDQCSSHWSLSLNPDIDYSDWSRVEDDRLLQAVQQHGTNWTMIASTFLPNRTTLALKNRYSALRNKAHPSNVIPPHKLVLDSRNGRPNAKRHLGHSTSSGSRFIGVDGIDNDEQTDDDDEDDDEDDEEEGDGAGDDNAETFLNPDWQASISTNRIAAQGRDKKIRPIAQSSFRLPPANETQRALSRPPAIAHWDEDTPNPSMSPATYHPNPIQTSYQHSGFDTFGPSSMSVNFGIGPNFTVSPDLYSIPRTEQSIIPQNTLSANYSNPKESQDTLMCGLSHVSNQEAVGQSTHEDMAASAYHHDSIDDSVTQQELTATKHRSATSSEALSTPKPSQGSSQAPTMASSPVPNPLPPSLESKGVTLHHVSVDAECTGEQLGDLVRTLVGVTKKIVVRVDD